MIFLRQLIRAGFRRGIRHGSRAWLVTGIVAWTVHFLIKASYARDEVLTLRRARPGDTFEVSIRSRGK